MTSSAARLLAEWHHRGGSVPRKVGAELRPPSGSPDAPVGEGRVTVSDSPVGGIDVNVVDATERLVATGTSALQEPGETIAMTIEVKPEP